MTVSEWLSETESRLGSVGIESARIEAQQLAAHVLRVDRPWLMAHPEHEFNELAGEQLVQRRLAGEPLAYILGWREFYGRTFGVDPSVLIPRHETETVVEAALSLGPSAVHMNGGTPAREHYSVLDLGTGSGILAITLSLERPKWEVTAVDLSPEAIATASANARFLGANVRFVVSDLFQALLGENFDMIVANPPYIGNFEDLPKEIMGFEPAAALFGGQDGLDFYRRIAEEGLSYISDGGILIFEVGYTQSDEVRFILESRGWGQVETRNDMSGVERVVVARHVSE